MSSISKSLRQQVINEAGYRCEYCRTSSRLTGMSLDNVRSQLKIIGKSSNHNNK